MTDQVTPAPAGDHLELGDVERRIKAIFIGSIGNLVEWYDFYAYTAFALYFAPAFFPQSDPVVQQLNAAVLFAATFLMRPLGGWLFGYLADRYGRRLSLTLSVVCMCFGSLIIAATPTYASIGLVAPAILAIARVIEGRRGGLVEFLPKGMQGAFGAARTMEKGGRLGILVDVKENKGIEVPFFGHAAMTGTVAATLAIRYGAALHGIWTERLGPGRSRITVEPALEVPRTGDEEADTRAIMAAINARIESWIRQRPDQWLWIHRRWPKEVYARGK